MDEQRVIEYLKKYFIENSKSYDSHCVGTEFELFALDSQYRSIPYSGDKGVHELLLDLERSSNLWALGESINGKLISLNSTIGSITLEPAAQIELSSRPCKNLFEIQSDWNTYLNSLNPLAQKYDLKLYGLGVHPFQKPSDLELLPKPRYQIMNEHFKQTGTMGHWMMRCSASTQVTSDYNSIEDLFTKLQLSFKLAPFTLALFANSCFQNGKQSDYLCLRGLIWANTDQKRSGIPKEIFMENLDLEFLSQYLLKTTAMFRQDGSTYSSANNKNFFQIHQKDFPNDNSLKAAIETHLSQIFTETRVKNYIEFRTADAQSPKFHMSVPAFYKGIFNDQKALYEALELLKDFEPDDIHAVYKVVPRQALNTPAKNYTVLEITKKLLEIACRGLDRQAQAINMQRSEQIFLHPLMEIVFENSYCPAQYFLRSYEKDFNRNLHETLKMSKY